MTEDVITAARGAERDGFLSLSRTKDTVLSLSPSATPLVFVHIQKTGGSAIAKALGHEENGPHKHRMAWELRDLYGASAFDAGFKFAFVRNPWDRLVSWWSMIDAARAAHAAGAQTNNFFDYVLANATTFEAFIVNCRDDIHDPDGRKCIFRNQLDYVTDADGRMLVDFVGRFENLQSDFDRVLQVTHHAPITLSHLNKSVHAHYTDFYDTRLRKIVEDAFARDIAAFGYGFGR
jgi:hypothetical protein